MPNKPILCLDFDGVLHAYTTPWSDAGTISDGPVPGAFEFLIEATEHFEVAIFSSRSSTLNGRAAMAEWLRRHAKDYFLACGNDAEVATRATAELTSRIDWPTVKPPAFLTIDDRALTFEGEWPNPLALLSFKPWNKRPTPNAMAVAEPGRERSGSPLHTEGLRGDEPIPADYGTPHDQRLAVDPPTKAICGLCGEPMPPGEEMFIYHGYSGPCPAPSKPAS